MDTITLAMAKAFTRRKIADAGISGGDSGGEVNLTPEQIEEILEAVKLKHTHENQSILDQITAEVLKEEVPHTYVLPETAKDGDLCLCAPTNTLTRADRKIYFDWEESRRPYISNSEEYSEAFCYYYGENETDGSGYSISINRGPEYCSFTLDLGGPDWTYNCQIIFQNGELIADNSYEYFDNAENPEGVERQFTTIEELPQYIELPQVDQVQTDNQNYDNVFLFYTEYELMKYQGGEWVKVEKNQITEEWLNNFSENTRLRHTHSNLDLLETIVPEMLEAEIPIVHTLPTESKTGDICRYAPANKIMSEDSGKHIYFDWKNIKHFSLKEVTNSRDLYEAYSPAVKNVPVLLITVENRNGSFCYIVEACIDNKYIRELTVSFNSYGRFNSGSLIIQDLSGNYVSGISYKDVDALPSFWELPKWTSLRDGYRPSNCYFFHTGYKLMKHQGDKWVEAVDVPTKTSQLENDNGFINEESVPTVYALPTEAQEGDLCFYISPNILTLSESGKRIYFDWEEFRKPVNEYIYFLFETGTIKLENGLTKNKVRISGEKSAHSVNHIYAENADTSLEVNFESDGEFRSGYLYSQNADTISYQSIEELPTFFDLPEFEEIVTNKFTTDNEDTQIPYFFHTTHNEYKLMKYQGGEWVEACASESGTLPVAYINDEGELCFELGSGINDARINDKGELELVIETENGDKTVNLGKVKGRTPELRLTEKILEIKYDDETEWNTLVDFSTIASSFDLRLNEETYFLEAQREVDGEWESMVDLSALKLAHEHKNKTALDKFTDELFTSIGDTIAKKHEHSNMEVLEGLAESDIENIADIPAIAEEVSGLTEDVSNLSRNQGRYNEIDTEGKYAHIIGNGTDDNNRSNAHTIDWEGNAWYQGSVLTHALIVDVPNTLEKTLIYEREIEAQLLATPTPIILAKYNYYLIVINDVEYLCFCTEGPQDSLTLGDKEKYGFVLSMSKGAGYSNLSFKDSIDHHVLIYTLESNPIDLISYINEILSNQHKELKTRVKALEDQFNALSIAEEVDF